MVIGLHPVVKAQARREPVVGLHPGTDFGRCIQTFILSCKVDGKAVGTIFNYEQQLAAFQRFLVKNELPQTLEDITGDIVRLFFLGIRERNCIPATSRSYRKNLKAFFNWVIAEGLLEVNPMSHIKPVRMPQKIIKPLSVEDIANMLALCAGNNFLDIRNRAILLLFLDTGLRLNELSSIQKKDIDTDNWTIKVFGKGGKDRIVKMGRSTMKALLKYLLMTDDSYPCLWVTERRKPFERGGIQTIIDRMTQLANVSSDK